MKKTPSQAANTAPLKHDPEKLADFSDKIMRQNKEHDPEKLPDFSDKIMRQNKEKQSAIDSRRNNRALNRQIIDFPTCNSNDGNDKPGA